MRMTLPTLMLIASVSLADDKPTMPPFRIDTEGFDASEPDIRVVLESAGKSLWRHYSGETAHEVEPFVVRRGNNGPFFRYRPNDRGELVILLDTGGTYWSQYSYQFAHEFLHLLCGRKNKVARFMWFEETLAETASLFAMRRMAEKWRTSPPYPHWADYRDSLRKYADDVIRSRAGVAEIHARGLAAYYRTHREALAKNPTDRELNGSMAVVLLHLLEKNPNGWEAVRWLNASTEPAEDFEEHLKHWRESVPERHHGFVDDIRDAFGFPTDLPD